MKLAVVVPIYNEEALLGELKTRLTQVLGGIGIDFEIIFVNDGSSDGSLEILKRFAQEDSHVSVVSLSRNFGHQQSITAGLSLASADAVVIMDGDLEDPPEVIPDLLNKWHEGFKVVTAQRRSRQVAPFKAMLFRAFHRLFQFLSDYPVPLDSGVFCLLDRAPWGQLLAIHETNRFIPGLRSWIGFRSTTIWYDRGKRHAGEPKQTSGRLLKYAFDAIFSFSYKPLRLSLVMGLFLFVLSSSYAFVLVILRILNINVVSGFTTVSVAILFFGGLMLVSNGILGEYLGRIYDEVKRRPLFVVDEVIRNPPGPLADE
jgi:glycosyltransferase involved in cell wall biosynthesis